MGATTVSVRLFGALICAAAGSIATAQVCTDDDTIGTCFDKFAESAPSAPADKGIVREVLVNTETGVDAGGLASSVKNFLPLLRVAGLGGDGGATGGDGLVALDLNFLVPGLRDNGQLQATINTDPKIYEPLGTALQAFAPTVEPETLIGTDVGESDDYSLDFTYGLASKRAGRNLEHHRTRFNHLFETAVENATQTSDQKEQAALLAQTELVQDGLLGNGDFTRVPFRSIPDATQRATAIQAAQRLAMESAATLRRVRENATRLGMTDFARLISNQPQLNVTLRRSARAAYVGPDETTLKLSYEFGFVNMNSFDKDSGDRCAAADKANPTDEDRATFMDCGAALREYLSRDDVRARLEHGDRLALSVAYSDVDDIAFGIPNSTFRFAEDGARKVSVAFSYGRLFGLSSGSADTRIDLEAKYEDASDNIVLNDRLIATATVTRKLGSISIPFSIVYSNRPQFVGPSDAKLGAHIGILFNTFSEKEK
jgi:hypothetical protein